MQTAFYTSPSQYRLEKRAEKAEINTIVNKIYVLESSAGKNDSCTSINKANGYGFAQNSRQRVCYENHEIVRKKVQDWFEDKLQTMDLKTALCYYNEGIKTNNCDYAKHYLTLK